LLLYLFVRGFGNASLIILVPQSVFPEALNRILVVLDHLLLLSLPLLVLVLHLAASFEFFSVFVVFVMIEVQAIHFLSLVVRWFLRCILGCSHNGSLIWVSIDCLLGFLVLCLRVFLSLLFVS